MRSPQRIFFLTKDTLLTIKANLQLYYLWGKRQWMNSWRKESATGENALIWQVLTLKLGWIDALERIEEVDSLLMGTFQRCLVSNPTFIKSRLIDYFKSLKIDLKRKGLIDKNLRMTYMSFSDCTISYKQ